MKIKLLLMIFLIAVLIVPTSVSAQNKLSREKDIAIQLYSVRSLIGNNVNREGAGHANLTAILSKLSQMGYTAVEAANYNNRMFYSRTPREFKKEVEAAGLTVLSSHTTKALTKEELASGDFSESLKWWDDAIKDHKEAGMSYIVTPWLDVPKTVQDLNTYCNYYNEIGKRCKANGLRYGYHNHAHEFQPVEGQAFMLDYMIEHTNPEYVFFEMDVYWTVIGKCSPVDYFNKYPGRFEILHIKDLREVGQSGMVGFDAIFRNTDAAGVKHIVVEVEKYSTPVEESIKTSLEYLQHASFVKKSYK